MAEPKANIVVEVGRKGYTKSVREVHLLLTYKGNNGQPYEVNVALPNVELQEGNEMVIRIPFSRFH